MVIKYDDRFTSDEFHYFYGTKGNDELNGNGSLHVMVGGGGIDNLNPGIGDRSIEWSDKGFWANIYPDGVREGFDHPTKFVYGNGIAQNFGGSNTVHVGQGVWVNGHVDPTRVIMHGPSFEGLTEPSIRMNFLRGDTMVVDNSLKTEADPNGIAFDDFDAKGFWVRESDGAHMVNLRSFDMESDSLNSSIKHQFAHVITVYDNHSGSPTLAIRYQGKQWQDNVEDYLENHVAGPNTTDSPDASHTADWFI